MNEVSAVNIPARRAFAELLRQFYSGRMTNDQYEARYWKLIDHHGSDSGIEAIYDAAWGTYDDILTHRMSRFWRRLSREQRRVIQRWILFLGTDVAYVRTEQEPVSVSDWCAVALLVVPALLPVASVIIGTPFWAPGVFGLLLMTSVLVYGGMWLWHLARTVAERVAGRNRPAQTWSDDTFPWPFRTITEFHAALSAPRYLAGRSAALLF